MLDMNIIVSGLTKSLLFPIGELNVRKKLRVLRRIQEYLVDVDLDYVDDSNIPRLRKQFNSNSIVLPIFYDFSLRKTQEDYRRVYENILYLLYPEEKIWLNYTEKLEKEE